MSTIELSRHGYNHMIVWLDKNIALPDCCREMKKAFAITTNPESGLQRVINEDDINNSIRDEQGQRDTSFLDVPFPFVLFDAVEPCLTFLLKQSTKKRIFFITSGELGEPIVPLILNDHRKTFEDNNGHINRIMIYIFCGNITYHSQWADNYVDLGCIKMGDDDRLVLVWITQDIAKYLESNGTQELSNENTSSLELAKQYFGWAKNLYEQANKIRPTYASNNPPNPITILASRIDITEQKLRALQKSDNDSDDDVPTSVEN